MKLTDRQQQVLDCIRRHQRQTGMPPTRAEIASELGFRSLNAAEDHLRALQRKGAIALLKGQSRGIRLLTTEASGEHQLLPLVGRVAAGAPLLAVAHIEDYLQVDARVFRPAADYLLRVQGMSMRDAGILDGDLLAVHRTHEARHGQILVVRVDDEVTVKRWHRPDPLSHRVALLPENAEFAPIRLDLRDDAVAIEGLAVGLLRALADARPL
jgi:repressor LexA